MRSLEKPDTRPTSSTVKSAMHKSDAARAKTTQPATHAAAAETVPFRELVEAYCAERDILFVPLGRAHATTGAPLFRAYATDKKGVHVYVEGDVVYAQPPTGGEAYRPVGMEEMVARARK
jgi:tuftelin-interacting protein 11